MEASVHGAAVHEKLGFTMHDSMIDANGLALSSMYTVDDNLMVVFYLENATATIAHLQRNQR